jgi:hypothetical protein
MVLMLLAPAKRLYHGIVTMCATSPRIWQLPTIVESGDSKGDPPGVAADALSLIRLKSPWLVLQAESYAVRLRIERFSF